MTERLYYNDSSLLEFDATVTDVAEQGDQALVSLDRSAFYPTSGGQNFDTGEIFGIANGSRVRVIDVQEQEQTGDIVHLIDCPPGWLQPGVPVRGEVDAGRRRHHMQQHSGQHVLSAVLEKLHNFPTVSFHMGEESCTIDLAVGGRQLQAIGSGRKTGERDHRRRPSGGDPVRYARGSTRPRECARFRQPCREKLRLIDIRDFDLNACGGTHVRSTGQIGAILVRKTEKVKQGVRVEFVCGLRAVNTARRDFQTLTDAASVFSTHPWELPQQARKSLDEIKSAQKAQHRLLEEVAELQAANLLRTAEERPIGSGQKLVVQFFPDRDLSFIKMLAQKLTRLGKAVVFVACGGAQPSLIFAQTPGLPNDMGALMKVTVQTLGTRGGGNRNMAQGGAPDGASAEQALRQAANALGWA